MPGGESVRVRLLGPVDVVKGETVRPVSGLRRKAILATLALHAGEVVSTDRLTDIVWGENPPPTAVNTLQSHVSHLRSVLGSKSVIRGTSPGYVLAAGEADTDVSLAERLLRTASTAADPAHAAGHLRAALALWRGQPLADVAGIGWRRLGTHPLSEAAAHRGLCWLDERANRPAPALGHAQRVRELHMAAGDKGSQAGTLNDVGYLYALNGDYGRAVECCEQALAELRELEDQGAEACTWHSLGFIYQHLRDYQRAIACYVRSLELTRDLADRFNEADTLCSLGDVYNEAGNVAAARQSWRYALLIFDEIGHPDAEQVRDKLRSCHVSGLPIVPVSLPDAGVKLDQVC